MASAALANITFFDSMACEILLQLNAIHILLQACKDRRRVDTPYSKDQVQLRHEPQNLGWFLDYGATVNISFTVSILGGHYLGKPLSLRAVCRRGPARARYVSYCNATDEKQFIFNPLDGSIS